MTKVLYVVVLFCVLSAFYLGMLVQEKYEKDLKTLYNSCVNLAESEYQALNQCLSTMNMTLDLNYSQLRFEMVT